MTRIARGGSRRGLTLVELIVAFTILLILSTMALPVARVKVRRDKEHRLRAALTEMRAAIDRYKDAVDEGIITEENPDNHGYPPSLEVLVEGVEANPGGGGMGGPGMDGNPLGGMPGMNGADPQSRSAFGNRNSTNQQRGSFGSQPAGQANSRSGTSGFGSRSGGSRSSNSDRGNGNGLGAAAETGEEDGEPTKIRFLRQIPEDPMTGRPEWGMRSVSDPPDSMTWGGDNVFDVFSLSLESSLDGELYGEW